MKRIIFLLICSLFLICIKAQDYEVRWLDYMSIEEANKEPLRVGYLILDKQEYEFLPTDIFTYNNLIKLNVQDNKLLSISDSIGLLKNLKELIIQDNELTHLPNTIGDLSNLEEFLLGRNKLTTFPESIWELNNIKRIFAGNNQITYLPPVIQENNSLEYLDLSNNKILEIPDGFEKLTALNELSLTNNKFTKLPVVLLEMSNLKKINISVKGGIDLTSINELEKTSFLEEFYVSGHIIGASSICKLTNLKKLSVVWSRIDFPLDSLLILQNLEKLNLQNCRIDSLPTLSSLTHLKELNVSYNQIKNLYESIKDCNLEKIDIRYVNIPDNEKELIKKRFPMAKIIN